MRLRRDKIQKKVQDAIKLELRRQGHYDTGNLERSFNSQGADIDNESIFQGFAADYIMELEEGLPANKIRIGEQEFQDLKGWVKRKIGAFSEAEATGITAAIIQNWKKRGFKPSPNSKEFSETGEILHAIKTVFERYDQSFADMVFDEADVNIDEEFEKTKSGTI